jgi:hypothetical protein
MDDDQWIQLCKLSLYSGFAFYARAKLMVVKLDFLSADYNTSLTLNYNFASGGATVDATLVAGYEPYPSVLSFINQTNEFKPLVGSKPSTAPWTADNSLFSAWFGVNDIGNSYYNSAAYPALANSILDVYFALAQQLYDAGGRNFAFLNVPRKHLETKPSVAMHHAF